MILLTSNRSQIHWEHSLPKRAGSANSKELASVVEVAVKGSVLTTKTWFLLIGAALLISAGVLNFRQRVNHETPPWDGVEWVDTNEGIIAKSIERGSAADRAWLLPGDRLIGVSLERRVSRSRLQYARDVQIYLEQARVGGQMHYLMKRPSYPGRSGAYWADLDNLGAIHKWTPRVIYINLIGLVLFVCRFLRALQAGWTRAVCPPFRDVLSRGVCLSFLHAGRKLSRSGSGDRVSGERRVHTLCAAVPALLCALPDAATTFSEASLARGLVVCSGDAVARRFQWSSSCEMNSAKAFSAFRAIPVTEAAR